MRNWKRRQVIWWALLHLFNFFHGNIFLPLPQSIGFHRKTIKVIQHLTKLIVSFFQLPVKNSNVFKCFLTFCQTQPNKFASRWEVGAKLVFKRDHCHQKLIPSEVNVVFKNTTEGYVLIWELNKTCYLKLETG